MLQGAPPMAALTPWPRPLCMCASAWISCERCKMETEGFKITETVVIFIMKLTEMCVRLRSAGVVVEGRRGEGEREEVQEWGSNCVCVYMWEKGREDKEEGGGVTQREQAFLWREKCIEFLQRAREGGKRTTAPKIPETSACSWAWTRKNMLMCTWRAFAFFFISYNNVDSFPCVQKHSK